MLGLAAQQWSWLHWLEWLLDYTSVRVVAAALTAFVAMYIGMPRLIAWLRARRLGEAGAKNEGAIIVDRSREAKAGTPTMGGLGIVAAIVLAAGLWCDFSQPQPLLLLVTLVAFAAMGLQDDWLKLTKKRSATGLSKRAKIAIQVGIGLALGYWFLQFDQAFIIESLEPVQAPSGEWAYSSEKILVEHLFSLPFVPFEWLPMSAALVVGWTVLMTFCCSNSVNLTDGMDGLAAGTMLIAAMACVIVSYLASHLVAAHHLGIPLVVGATEITVFAAAIAGACLGFLWYNCYPAQVFMGDTGSQGLGGVLAMMLVCCKQEFLLLLIGFVFFVEGGSVFLQVASYKLRGGKRIFLCAPLHHHYQYKNLPETKIVQRFWIVAGLMALVALSMLKLR